MNRIVISGFIGILGLYVTGCGYTHQRLFPQSVHTVAVPVFENLSFYQGVELDLTEALIKEIELRTPYKVTPSSEAQTILQGMIIEVTQQRLSRTTTGDLPQELETRITVDFEWKQIQRGQTLRRRRGLEAVGRYVPAGPIGEPFDVSAHQAVERLAGQIVSAMAENW